MADVDAWIVQRLVAAGAFVRGNYVLAGGAHTDLKFEIERAEADVVLMRAIAMMLEAKLEYPRLIDAVVGVPSGGVELARLITLQLQSVIPRPQNEVRWIPSEKHDDGSFSLGSEDMRFIDGKHLLLIEDALTTGGSTRRLMDLCLQAGAHVHAVASIVTRGSVGARELGVVEFVTLLRTDFAMTEVRQFLGP